MHLLLALLLMVLPIVSLASDFYAVPSGGSSTASSCPIEAPCTLGRTLALAQAGDAILLMDGTYSEVLATVRSGTSTAPIRIAANSRRQAILQFPVGIALNPRPTLVSIGHNWIVLEGLVLRGSAIAANTMRIGGTHVGTSVTWAQDIIVDDVLIENAGDAGINFLDSRRVTVRHSEINVTGNRVDGNPPSGVAFHLGSNASGSQADQIQIYNNVVRGVRQHQFVDFKNGSANANVHHNIFDGHVAGWAGGLADGLLRSLSDDGLTDVNHVFSDNVMRNAAGCSSVLNLLREVDVLNNVFYNITSCGSIFISAATSSLSAVDGNTTCSPSPTTESVNRGTNAHNQPMSTCLARVDAIVGVPSVASCEIGELSPTTMVVNLDAGAHPPVSEIADLQVTYDGVDQEVVSTTLTSGSEAQVEVAEAPVDNTVVVEVSAASGVMKNSAYMGAKSCDTTPDALAIGQGVCGVNAQETTICVNQTETPPQVDVLTQSRWRFYSHDGDEGELPIGLEMGSIELAIGQAFRVRMAVRGGGANAPSRAYELAARVCQEGCGSWVPVGDDPNLHGLVFSEDEIQVHGTPTTNQLALGGKTFVAGAFLERPGATPSIAIASTEQVEWEFSLAVSEASTVVSIGSRIELRMQHGDGTALSAYTLPSITIGSASSGLTGSISGTIQ